MLSVFPARETHPGAPRRARSADLSAGDVAAFRRLVRDFHREFGRDSLAWRQTRDPNRILMSEVMLQQTQVPRVSANYPEFLRAFPTIRSLAATPLTDVPRAWQGLGCNLDGTPPRTSALVRVTGLDAGRVGAAVAILRRDGLVPQASTQRTRPRRRS
jgi:hypothetical protein